MKKIYCLSTGLKGVRESVERGCMALSVTEDVAPDDAADGSFTETNPIWHTRIEGLVEWLNEEFEDTDVQFSIGGLGDQTLLEVNVG